jgi:hypothetical protein
MVQEPVHQCECEVCQRGEDAAQKADRQRVNLLMSRLDEQQRRWYAAVESAKIGFGGDVQVSRITGLNVETIRRGRREVAKQLVTQPAARIRLAGGGRLRVEKNSPK